MGIVEDKINDLKAREAKVLEMGGEKAVAAQREKGKLTARKRLDLVFDKGTFLEIGICLCPGFYGPGRQPRRNAR